VLVVYVDYRPPGAVTSTLIYQLSDLLNQLVLLNIKFVVVSDFSVPGDITEQLDRHVVDVTSLIGSLYANKSVLRHASTATSLTSFCHRKTR